MKATQKDFAGIAQRAVREARIFYFCGPDDAGIHDAATSIASLIESPGERIDISGADLKGDPVRLGDEARSTSLFGETRHIWVRATGDDVHDAVETMLSSEVPVCPVLIVATGATDKSRVAKLLAPRKDALVAMFWPPDQRSVIAAVRTMLGAAGLRAGGDIAERIARGCNLDTRIAQSEVSKLALYLDASPQAPRGLEADVLDAIAARTEDDSFLPIVNAVLSGDTARLGGELRRMREHGINPVGLLLAFERRVAQLAQLAAKLGPGQRVRDLMEAEKAARRINFREERDLSAQLERWKGPRLARLVDRLVALHRALLANSQQAELFLSQGLTEIARVATR